MKKIIFALLMILVMASTVFAYGEYADVAKRSDKIVMEQYEGYPLFAIKALDTNDRYSEQFSPGDWVTIRVDQTAYNVPPVFAKYIVEVYVDGQFEEALYQDIGIISGDLAYHIANIQYKINEIGDYELVGYMHTSEYSKLEGDSTQTGIISGFARTAFVSGFPTNNADECPTRLVGEKNCDGNANVVQTEQSFDGSTCRTSVKIIDDCNNNEICQNAQCVVPSADPTQPGQPAPEKSFSFIPILIGALIGAGAGIYFGVYTAGFGAILGAILGFLLGML